MLIVTGSVISIAEGRLITAHGAAESAEARLLSEKVVNAIEVSYSGGEGHEIRIEMPSNIRGSDYIVKVNKSGVLVMVGGRCAYSFSYMKEISNYDLDKYEVVMLPKRTYTIQNIKDNNNCTRVVIFEDL